MVSNKDARKSRPIKNHSLTAAVAALACCVGLTTAIAAEGYEYAAGEVTLPFGYSATVSSAPRPACLDFADMAGYPDNCQALVRMDGELWEFKRSPDHPPMPNSPARYKGPDIDHMVRQEDAVTPPGYTMAWFLGGLWYDESERKLYAPMHIEALGINRARPVAPWASRKVILATSTDKGKTWHDEGDIISPETYFYVPDAYKFSGSDFSNGLCDYGFYADTRGGYFYLYPMEAWLPKGSSYCRWSSRVARCAIGDKMAPGKWKFFYNGKWDQPALGGKSSVVAPVIWPIIFSTYLQKYVCIFPSSGGPAAVAPDYTDGVYLGFCTDLSKQDWKWARMPEALFGFMNVLNEDGSDITTCGKSIRLYSYFNGNTFRRLDVTFKEGTVTGTEVQPRYSFEPHPESSDRIQGRQTKFVGSTSGDAQYEGNWSDRSDPLSYQGHLKECASSGSVTLTFEGPDVYWRALRSPDSGKADVYVDGALRKTVDCYSPQSTDYEQIVYILTGLSPHGTHTIKVVARGDKNATSKGKAIRHIGFEYSAESYKASAGFCSLMGKNNWNYQEWNGSAYEDMRFCESLDVVTNYWFGKHNRIGPDYQDIETGAAAREWVAPHGGAVRIEGHLDIEWSSDGATASITRNGAELWPEHSLPAKAPVSHDLTVEVEQGDTIFFVVKKPIANNRTDVDGDRVTWDPVITYTQSSAPIWKPNPPNDRNLALGKYARSKRLFHAYKPFNAVDGSSESYFAQSDADLISSGNDDWLMVDLDKTYLIDRYVLLSRPQQAAWRPDAFVLQKSDDGLAWTDVDTITHNTLERLERALPAFKARFVRLYLPHGRPFLINEFELYYTAGAPISDVRRPSQ